jgi:hypothetical protein
MPSTTSDHILFVSFHLSVSEVGGLLNILIMCRAYYLFTTVSFTSDGYCRE